MPRRKSSEHPHPVDVHVGQRVRERRILLGMSQQNLGIAIGITFQQIQKYEKGTNRIGCSRLFDLAEAQNVPIAYFFEGYTREGGSDENVGLDTRTLRLAGYFDGLPESHKDSIFDLVKSLATSSRKRNP